MSSTARPHEMRVHATRVGRQRYHVGGAACYDTRLAQHGYAGINAAELPIRIRSESLAGSRGCHRHTAYLPIDHVFQLWEAKQVHPVAEGAGE